MLGLSGAMFLFDPQSDGLLHQLFLPLLAAIAFHLVVQAWLATALAVALLASLHTDFTATWIEAVAYPIFAVTAWSVVLAIGIRRMKTRISDTHSARWAQRHERHSSRSDAP